MQYTIWIVTPPRYSKTRCFEEVAEGLKAALVALGHEASVVTEFSAIKGTPIVLGGNILAGHKLPVVLPKDAIIFNLENVNPNSWWFLPERGYTDLMRTHRVWDFSFAHIEKLKNLGIRNVVHCGIGYVPELTRLTKADEDIDVLLIGDMNPRRRKVIDQLKAAGHKVEAAPDVYGAERDALMTRSKLVLQVHPDAGQVPDMVRIPYALANKKCVISETGNDPDMAASLEGAVVFCGYDALAETCERYLKDNALREVQAKKGFEAFSRQSQTDMVANALAKTESMKPVVSELPHIFVQIVSYRDPECGATLKNLFEKATHPERVFAGVCWQYDPDDKDIVLDGYPRADQVRVVRYHVKDCKGAGWARNEAQALYNGEQYVLQIQAHMRFEPGWDETLIHMLKRCPSDKPIITAYLAPYDPPDNLRQYPNALLRTRIRELGTSENDAQIIHFTTVPVSIRDKELTAIYPTPVWIGNFLFTEAKLFDEVPNDPHIYFWGEELAYSARLWTHGWDMFQPDCVIGYHQWDRKETASKQGYRNMANERNQRSRKRINHLLGFEYSSDAQVLADIGKYGLGHKRTLQSLWDFMGVDWRYRNVSKDSTNGRWNIAARNKAIEASNSGLERIFVQIACMRDPECQWTVKDMFEKADRPERIFVGICWQYDPEDSHCFKIPYPYPDQVRAQMVPWRESKGLSWARQQTQYLWRGEEYSLQIDAHMRFAPGWDTKIIKQLEMCDSPKPVMSCYPAPYTPPNNLTPNPDLNVCCVQEFFKDGNLRGKGDNIAFKPSKPLRGAFLAGGFVFARSNIITEIPYDPHPYFDQEEMTYALRLYTHGWDMFSFSEMLLYHYYNDPKKPKELNSYWSQRTPEEYKQISENARKGLERFNHITGYQEATDSDSLVDIEKYPLGKVRTLQQFEVYTGVDFKRKHVSEKALHCLFNEEVLKDRNKKRGPVPNLGAKPRDSSKARIFINIASYRDPECQWTVKDLFEKAKYPDRVFVGICWQFDQEEDKHCFEVTTRPDQVRVLPVDWRDAEGVCWARHQTQLLHEGEEYTLMIDSHMRFMPGWDELMIEELALCDSNKPVLSCSPPMYTPPNNLHHFINPSVRRVKPFMQDGNIRCQGEALDVAPPKPLKGAFLVANFVFSRSEIIKEVPYDPYLYFDQEEITYAARLYTHGWDVFHPHRQFLYHYYNDRREPEGGSVRPLHWHDLHKENRKQISFLRDRGLKRFNHMTGYRFSNDPEVLKELEAYGFGKERTLSEFEAYTGLDFKRKIAGDRALRCEFIEDLGKYRRRPIIVPEIDNKKKEPAKPQVTTAAAPVKPAPAMAAKSGPIEPGDFIPLFETVDHTKRHRSIELIGGRHSMLIFFPSESPYYAEQFFRELAQHIKQEAAKDIWQVFIMDGTPEQVSAIREKLSIKHTLWCDPERKIVRALGVASPADKPQLPVGITLNKNLKIGNVYNGLEPGRMAEVLLNDCMQAQRLEREKNPQRKVISEMAPALIVPDVLSPEFCERCIRAFRTGKTFDGTVGAGEHKAYRPDTKVRTDYITHGELLRELDDKFSRSFFPEIKKIFGFEVTHRETYKIGMYSGEKGGFFRQHRDNFEAQLGYRRIASTIHLNDGYEGGGLMFPEYGDTIYRPNAGSAIAFSCQTLHEALPVTKGERFVIVGFFHGMEDESFRQYHANHPPRPGEFEATLRRYPEIRQSRDFFKDWQEENVRYNVNGIKKKE